MWRSYIYYILGIRPVIDGLLVDPRIPASWSVFAVSREFRNAKYEITVKNPNHLTKGVRRMNVNGQSVAGNVIPAFSDGATHRVDILLES